MLAMMAIAPLVGVLPTISEWRRTGQFQWTFERTTHAPSDEWLTLAGMTLCCAGLVLYYAFPLTRRRPSPGACIAGYQIVSDDGAAINMRIALLRTLLGLIAVCTVYLAPFIARDRKKGKFWVDAVFGTRALVVS
jgi:uncharacterized RDD family membrane protein YckC